MNEFGEVTPGRIDDRLAPPDMPIRQELRAATLGPHERLHRHDGLARIADGTITRLDYGLLLSRLYSFFLPFEWAVGTDHRRTQWLERDLVWLGFDPAAMSRADLCRLPRYENHERRLGALYVVEVSALGGRQLFHGLDPLFGATAIEGRRFFAGRGSSTGEAWCAFLAGIDSVAQRPQGCAAMIDAAVETFAAFETWLDGWRDAT